MGSVEKIIAKYDEQQKELVDSLKGKKYNGKLLISEKLNKEGYLKKQEYIKSLEYRKKLRELKEREMEIKAREMDLYSLEEKEEENEEWPSKDNYTVEYSKYLEREEIEKEKAKIEEEKARIEKVDVKKEVRDELEDKKIEYEYEKAKTIRTMNDNRYQLGKDLEAKIPELELELEEAKKKLEEGKRKLSFGEIETSENPMDVFKDFNKYKENVDKIEKDIKICKEKLEETRNVITDIPELFEFEKIFYNEEERKKTTVASKAKGYTTDKKPEQVLEYKGLENSKIIEDVEKSLKDKESENPEIEDVEEEYEEFGNSKVEDAEKTFKDKESENPEIEDVEEEYEEFGNSKVEDVEKTLKDKEIENPEIEDIEEGNLTKIEIGRTGKITFYGKEYKVNKNIIKQGLNLSVEETLDILKDKLQISTQGKYIDIIENGIKQKIIDSTVINTIISSKMEESEEISLLSKYVLNCVKAKEGREYKNICNVTYNEEDLSKSNFLSRIFKKEINANDKVEMLYRAMVGKRYVIASSVGEYKPDLVSRVMSRITGNKIPLLSQRIDSVHKVANIYNELRDENKVNDKEKFKQELRENVRISHFSGEQYDEINELRNSQTKQEQTEK